MTAYCKNCQVVWLHEKVMQLEICLTKKCPQCNMSVKISGLKKRKYRIMDKFRIIKSLWLFQKRTCIYCKSELSSGNITVDHVIPRSKGGKNGISNLAPCCRDCNNKKGDIIYDNAN